MNTQMNNLKDWLVLTRKTTPLTHPWMHKWFVDGWLYL